MSNPSDGSKTDTTDTKSDQTSPSPSPPPRRISFASSPTPRRTSQSSGGSNSSAGPSTKGASTVSAFEAARTAKQREEAQTVKIGTPSDVGFTYLKDLEDDDALEVPQENTK